tara:strand:+ start:542 stop:1450 length:909 start_codon:yes stop_codon:yes gene_type:complete
MFVDFNKQIETIHKIRTGEIKTGLKLGVPELDTHFVLKPSDLNLFLGHANVGKTSLVLFMMLCYSVRHNSKWLIYSSENEPYELIRKLLEYLVEEPINRIIPNDFNKGIDFIKKHFKFISNERLYTYKELIDVAEKAKVGFKYNGFLIDPYNSLAKDRETSKALGMHEYDYEVLSQFRMFCQRNKVSLWLCAHANTEALRRVYKAPHEYQGYPMVCESSSIEGGGKFVNRCDSFAVVHRFIQHPTEFMYSFLHIKKIKSIETGGRCTSLDAPVKMRALINNVGYSINNESIVKILKRANAPF